MSKDQGPGRQEYRLKRRQFLANLLFAGGALTFAGLQSAAQAEPNPTAGWTLPDLNTPDPKPTPPPPPPLPQPPGGPGPPTAGKPAPPSPPPNPRGRVVVPDGGVTAPPRPGDYVPSKPGRVVAPPTKKR